MDVTCTSAYRGQRHALKAAAELCARSFSAESVVMIQAAYGDAQDADPDYTDADGWNVSIAVQKKWRGAWFVHRYLGLHRYHDADTPGVLPDAMRLPVEALPAKCCVPASEHYPAKYYVTMWPYHTPTEMRRAYWNGEVDSDCTNAYPTPPVNHWITPECFRRAAHWDTCILPCADAACRCMAELGLLGASQGLRPYFINADGKHHEDLDGGRCPFPLDFNAAALMIRSIEMKALIP